MRGGLPFTIEVPQYSKELLDAAYEARRISHDPDIKGYTNIDDLKKALEAWMLKIKFTSAYKKSYKLMKKRGLDLSLLDDVVEILRQGKTLEDKYKDHELKGKLKGFRECHIQPDWLLIYLIENDILTLTLVDTGSHSDLLNM